ncbi:MAG: single-stranded DNA-binding protein [Acidimicrobiaceae bacterium]|nr:single-stranded DNA-binding protein [Acidimicrobiaceae bacterium]MYE08382.1 single-stranded DNA-binding protein [Acidimicrobiaceae bacterium]MYI35321.1 single-stranded DNA-binding protein [Acidimicrobiaceae bacterium]
MGFDNTVTVVGNVTRDPELRFAQSGMAIAQFGVAWNRRRQDQEDEVSFFDVTCFRQLAENVAESVRKGARVVIYGTLQQRSWETDSGDRRSKVEILADDVAPSLKWATAAITRNERPGGGDYRGGHRGDGGSRGSSGARPAGLEALESRRAGGTQQSGAASSSVDEEPF